MEKRPSCDDASDSSSSSDKKGGDNYDEDHHDGEEYDDNDSIHEQVVAGDRHSHKNKSAETHSSNSAVHHTALASVADGKISNSTTTEEQLARLSPGTTTTAIVPSRKDVLLGRGRPYQNFGGNKRMLRIVSRFKDEYAARPRDQKRLFVETVLDVVLKDEGTRFLRRIDDSEDGSSDQWEEVDRSTAADKVWHALRSKDRSMKSKDSKRRGVHHQEGNVDDESVVSRSSRMKNAERHKNQRHNLAVSRDTTSSSDGIVVGCVDTNASSKPLQERSQERDGISTSTQPSIESLTREIAYHLNKAVTATNLLSALIGAPLHLPSASLPLTMLAGETRATTPRDDDGMQAPLHQHDNDSAGIKDVERVINQNAFLPVGPSLGASAPPIQPTNHHQVQSNAPLPPFSSLAGLVPTPFVIAQYLNTLSNGGIATGRGGLMRPSVPASFPDSRQIAQMTALYPQLLSGGNVATSVPSSSSSHQPPPQQSSAVLVGPQSSSTSQQILLHALAALSQLGAGQSPAPPR